jgi:hypothetical protein
VAITVRSTGFAATGPTLLTGEPYVCSDSTIWVDSITGSDSNAGTEETAPKATVFGASGAISVLTGSLSELVVCKETHRETISGAYTWSKGGITLISRGSGTARAQFTNADIITVSGAAVRIENCYFPPASAAINRKFNVTGAGFEMRDCQLDGGANEATDLMLINAVAHATIRGTTFKVTASVTGTTRTGLRVTGAATNCLVEACTFNGGSYGWTSGYALQIESATTDQFRVRDLTLLNYSFAGASTSGAKGYFGGAHSIDPTSGIRWTE